MMQQWLPDRKLPLQDRLAWFAEYLYVDAYPAFDKEIANTIRLSQKTLDEAMSLEELHGALVLRSMQELRTRHAKLRSQDEKMVDNLAMKFLKSKLMKLGSHHGMQTIYESLNDCAVCLVETLASDGHVKVNS